MGLGRGEQAGAVGCRPGLWRAARGRGVQAGLLPVLPQGRFGVSGGADLHRLSRPSHEPLWTWGRTSS